MNTPTVTPTAGNLNLTKEQKIQLILDFCKEAKSRQEIMNKIGLKDKNSFLSGYLNPLLKEGKLDYTEPEKPNSPTQKYYSKVN